MTSTRKKKKMKCDPRASEKMRNWLTKPKKHDSTPPVPFSVFRKVVENLPDIAFQIQRNEPHASCKSLDECALWYYNAFYSDPSVREKYEYKLRSCPLRIKQKLLQGSSACSSDETSDSNDIELVPTEDGHEVTVNRCGKFLFPVSLATFERYIDKPGVLKILVRKETKSKTERAALLLDKDVCRKLFRKYYNSFYIDSSRRHMEKCKFETAPAALRQQLLKMGVPLDELAVKTLERKSHKLHVPGSPKASPAGSPQDKQPVARISPLPSIVSFNEFEKYIINIYDIVWRLKLDESKYSYKGFEDCAYDYYFDFYLTPEIREKYPFVLAPCTNEMKDRILSLPSEGDRNVLLQMKIQGNRATASQPATGTDQDNEVNLSTSPAELAEAVTVEDKESELPIEAIVDEHQPNILPSVEEEHRPSVEENLPELPPPVKVVEEKWSEIVPPVSFKLFKRYIRNIDNIVEQMLSSGKFKGRTADECALEYYNRFYCDPEIREQFEYQVKPCPGRIREQLLSVPGEAELLANSIAAVDKGNNTSLPTERKLITIEGITYELLISFETFAKYINYEELAKQLTQSYKMKKGMAKKECPSDEQLMRRFYFAFYTDQTIRTQFKWHFNGAPVELREQLMQLAKRVGSEQEAEPSPLTELRAAMATEESEESVNINTEISSMERLEIDISDCELDVVEDLGSAGCYKFPVSFDTFMRCINHKELLRPLLLRITQDEEQLEALVADPLHSQCQKIFKRYYRSFYVRPSVRSLYEYRFSNVSAELLKKLLEYAEPLDEKAKQQIAEELALAEEKKKQEQIDEIVKTLPVTFKLFKRNIRNLEEVVKWMKGCEEHKNKSEEECAFEYYIQFYTKPEIREKFEFELRPCPSKLREKLLQLPAASSETEIEQSGVVEVKRIEVDSRQVEANEPEPKEQPETEVPETTKATEAPEAPQVDCNANEPNNNKVLVREERILITLQGNTYEFPVSLQTFKRYINYETVRIELANSFSKDKQKVEKILRDERYDLVLLRRFYHSFYIDPRARKLCNYHFNAAPAELQSKLQQFAVQCSPKPAEPKQSEAPDGNSSVVPAKDSSGTPVAESQVERISLPRIESQVDQEKEWPPQLQQNPDIKYPISFNIFSKTLNLDEVVRQMQQEPKYAKATAHDCMLAYYDAFYRTPKIREKYKCSFRPCPALLKAKLLQIPLNDLTSECSQSRENSASIQGSAAVYASRKAELKSMAKSNVINYTPCNVRAYIEHRTKCPKKSDLLVKHFTGNQTTEPKENGEIVRGSLERYEKATVEENKSIAAEVTRNTAAVATEIVELDSTTTITISSKTVTTTTTTTTIAETTEAMITKKVIRKAMPEAEIIGSSKETIGAPALATATTTNTDSITLTKTVTNMAETTAENTEENVSSSSSSGISLKNAPASMALNKMQQETAEELVEAKHLNEIIKRYNPNNPALTATVMVPASALKAVEEFFRPSDKMHNMKYLLCTSYGLKNTIWRILSHLSQAEFKLYTSIYGGTSLYEDESILSLCYYYVLNRGNWPTNFYVKLRLLPQLLQKKGIQLNALDLSHLSPKMLHREELFRFTNFDEIVERHFHGRTGHEIDNLQDLFNESEKFYAMCWTQDRWLHQVPQITEELAHSINWTDYVPVEETTPPSTLPLCMAESQVSIQVISSQSSEERQEENNNVRASPVQTTLPENTASTSDVAIVSSQSSICPPTQLDVFPSPTCFVDMQALQPASQAMQIESQSDPLNQSSLVPAETSVRVKTEPMRFLNMMRFTLNSNSSSDNFNCELIGSEEQIINLDPDDEKRSETLACFDISNSIVGTALPSSCASSTDSYQNLLAEVHRLDDELNTPPIPRWGRAITPSDNLLSAAQIDDKTDVKAQQGEPTAASPGTLPVPVKKQTLASTAQTRKRPRLMADNVPQLRHEFRPLPLTAMVRIEPDALVGYFNQEELPTTSGQVQQLPQQPESQTAALTASQALSTDNTLMESSQLQTLLDAPFINQRKVNVVEGVSDSNKNKNRAAPLEERRKRFVFRSLERYLAFSSLTTEQISRYHINSLSVGSPYQQALISVNGRLCNVTGPMLQTLFSRCTASLQADLEYLLRDIDEFSYNSRQTLRSDSTEDLRTRVLYTFMRVAPPFVRFRLEFQNETREWATCSAICEQERDRIEPKSDVQTVIRPEILARMKQLKLMLLHPYK